MGENHSDVFAYKVNMRKIENPLHIRRKFRMIFLVFLTVAPLSALESVKPLLTSTPPVIDGTLDDPVWEEAPSVTGFKTFTPDYGKDMEDSTRVFMAYDEDFLFFAFRCNDSRPDLIKTSVSSRDSIRADDWICINLDTFGDHQGLYAFYVNPLGIQMDSRFAAGQEDPDVDVVWYSAGRVDEGGYSVEVKIPLRSIRFRPSDPVQMGVIFERKISRRAEQGTFPPLSPESGIQAFLMQMMPLHYSGLKRKTLLEILPAATYSHRDGLLQGKMTGEERKGTLSLTGKYGITSDLILDGTINPDFSQVEADAGQVDVNLRSALYYSEKRPFFLEGRESFNLGGTAVSELDPVISLLHTRTIVNPLLGFKLSGKVGAKDLIASIYAVDELSEEGLEGADRYAHFSVLRYKRALGQDSFLGGLYAGRNYGSTFNRIFGLDGQVRLGPSHMLEYQGLLSQAKRFPEEPEKTDNSYSLRYRYDHRNIEYQISVRDISRDFQADMGFITRTGIFTLSGLVRPKLYPKSGFIRRIDTELFTAQTRDRFDGMWETFNHLSVQTFHRGNSTFKIKYSLSTEIFLGQRFRTGGFHAMLSGQFTKQFSLGILYRGIEAIYYSQAPFQGRSNRLSAVMTYLPSEKLHSELNLTYVDFARRADSLRIYDYPIARGKLTYQVNRFLFFRGIVEYNGYRKELLTDVLASFTYIPGTVIHMGYGALHHRQQWVGGRFVEDELFHEYKRAFFFKVSYLWRL